MSTKDEALHYIRALAEQKIVTKEEIEAAYDLGSGAKTDVGLTKKIDVAEVLYYIGGLVVFLGIAILLAQNWTMLGFVTKVLATLGAGVAAYVAGVVLSADKKTETVGSAFYLISALTIPLGIFVVFDNAGFNPSSYGSQTMNSGILFGMYVMSYFVLRKNVFVLFSILFGSWFFFSLTSFMVGGSPNFDSWTFYEYRVLMAGIAYMLLGNAFSKSERAPLSGFLYGFGVFGFLGSALALGGWEPSQNVFWELLYPGLIFGILFIGVHLKVKSFLTWGTIFLMVYILKITSEYFSSGLGWPLALVIAGLAMIGVGYMSFSLKKKYFSS